MSYHLLCPHRDDWGEGEGEREGEGKGEKREREREREIERGGGGREKRDETESHELPCYGQTNDSLRILVQHCHVPKCTT